MTSTRSDTSAEWTFEMARRRWKPLVRPVAHVGIPGNQWQTGVLWDGALVFGPLWQNWRQGHLQREVAPLGDNLLHVSVGFGERMRFADRKGTADPAIQRWIEGGRLPIPHVRTVDGDLIWEETVFAHLLGRKLEDGMKPKRGDVNVTHALFRVRNAGQSKQAGHLWLHFGDTGQISFKTYHCDQGAELAEPAVTGFEPPYGTGEGKVRFFVPSPEKGKLTWRKSIPPPIGMSRPAKSLIEWQVALSPGEEAELRLILPYGWLERAIAEKLARLDSHKLLDETREAWRKLLHRQAMITTPDPLFNDFLIAAAGHMAQQVCYQHATDLWMYWCSPNHYSMYYPVCSGRALPTFDYRGLTHISRPVLKDYIRCQSDWYPGQVEGSEGYEKRFGFLSNFGGICTNPIIWGHGIELWNLATHYRITRDREWLGEGNGSPLQAMLDGCDWIAAQRRRTMCDENGSRVPHWGLLPAGSVHDWLSGNAIINDAWCIYGVAQTVRLLREIEHSRAEEVAAELTEYRKDLRDAYVRARDASAPLPLPDGSSIPFVPRVVQETDWREVDWTYTDYGPTRAGCLGALDPNDELVNQALAFVEAGLPKGEGRYIKGINPEKGDASWLGINDPEAERHYLNRHHVDYETNWPQLELFLQRDDLPRFFECLFSNMAVIHEDFRTGMESIDGTPACAPFEGDRWLGIRGMFVNERGGYDGSRQSLWLLQAVPREWLKPGSVMSVRDMPTCFGGTVSLNVWVAGNGHSVEAAVELKSLAVAPKEIVVRLRSGDGRPLASATVNKRKVPVLPGDTIRLPVKKDGTFSIVGRFGR